MFLASEKFNPVRECGPGFRKNLVVVESKAIGHNAHEGGKEHKRNGRGGAATLRALGIKTGGVYGSMLIMR